MHGTLFILLIVALVVVAQASTTREKIEELFYEHMVKYDLDFADGKEFIQRIEAFAANLKVIEEHNSNDKKTFTMGLNQFSHLSNEEWKKVMGFSTKPPSLRKNAKVHGEPTVKSPDSVDWVSAGAVTPVKNQGQCGSCWSFSTTGGLEGAYQIKTGTLTSFSEQILVSCDNLDNACNGGWMDQAFEWTQSNGGIVTEDAYPYVSGTGQVPACDSSLESQTVSGSAPSSYTDVQQGSVSALMDAVAQQPVSVAIQADQMSFQHYSSGVLTSGCGQQLDHGVLAVGYGTEDGTDFWKVKNSWGPTWGDNGYILIERSDANLCGILNAASYPTL